MLDGVTFRHSLIVPTGCGQAGLVPLGVPAAATNGRRDPVLDRNLSRFKGLCQSKDATRPGLSAQLPKHPPDYAN